MSIRHTARGIVIFKDQLLLIERWRDNLHYFSVPGGGIETGESPQQALSRELQEETGIEVEIKRPLYELTTKDGGTHTFFLCEYVRGEPALHPESEEAHNTSVGDNRFKPRWVPLAELMNLPFFVWKPIQQQLNADIMNGFSSNIKILRTSP